MATIDTADLSLLKTEHANVSNVVGIGEKNEKNDVLLVQSLFRLVGFSEFFAKKFFGIALKDLPEPTGSLDEKTIWAIWGFQRHNAGRLLNIDGKIHPANYQGRVIKKAFLGRVMAITFLNSFAIDGALVNFNTDVIPAIKQIAPSIIFV
jgi:hypothetical protein